MDSETLPSPSLIKGIIFDLDGTLYHMKPAMKPLFFLHLFPFGGRLSAYMHIRESLKGRDFGSAVNLLDYLSTKLANKTRSSPQKMRNWIDGPFFRGFTWAIKMVGKGTRPGINRTIAELKESGIKCAICSDFAHIPERLSVLGINPDLFDTIISSEELGVLKPNAKPYQYIIDTWKIDPKYILFIGDRVDTDGIAAQELHMPFILISDDKKKREGIFLWGEVREFLRKLIQ